MTRFDIINKYAWIVLLPLVFLLYANSFNAFPILEEKHSVLAEADSAAFMIPIRDFHLEKKYGDEYNQVNRGLQDVAQKHKIHHVLYVILAGGIFEFFAFSYRFFGISSTQALYSINAFLSCVNISLFYILLKHFNPGDKRTSFFLLFYAFSLSTWIYGSVPESWTLSTTLVLTFLILLYKKKLHYLFLSIFVGIAMLNNIFLSSLFLFLFVEYFIVDRKLLKVISKTALSGSIAVCTWAIFMSFFALFDSSLNPVNYLKYTLWFKTSVAPPVQLCNISQWEVAITSLLINSILSNQSDPIIPRNAILLTFREGFTGVITTLIYLALMMVVLANLISHVRSNFFLKNTEEGKERPYFLFIAYSVLWIFLIVIMDPGGGFLYSTLIVPMLLMLTDWFVDFKKPYQKFVFYAALGGVIFNNIVQIVKFRDALAAFH